MSHSKTDFSIFVFAPRVPDRQMDGRIGRTLQGFQSDPRENMPEIENLKTSTRFHKPKYS